MKIPANHTRVIVNPLTSHILTCQCANISFHCSIRTHSHTFTHLSWIRNSNRSKTDRQRSTIEIRIELDNELDPFRPFRLCVYDYRHRPTFPSLHMVSWMRVRVCSNMLLAWDLHEWRIYIFNIYEWVQYICMHSHIWIYFRSPKRVNIGSLYINVHSEVYSWISLANHAIQRSYVHGHKLDLPLLQFFFFNCQISQ